MRGRFDLSGDGELRESRGRIARTMYFAGSSTGCLLLLALAGCMSSSDAPLGAQSLDQTSVSVDSSAFAFNGAAAAPTDDASSSGSSAAASSVATAAPAGSAETASSNAPTPLAVTASAPQSPAVAAANAAITDSGEPVAVPTPSPRDAAAPVDVATTGTEVMTAADAPDDEPPASAAPENAVAKTGDTTEPTPAAEQKVSPLARLFSSNRTGQKRNSRSVSSREGETALIPSTRMRATAAAARSIDTISTGSTGTAHIQLASATTHGEEMEALPGVRLQSLYEFPRAEQEATNQARVELASAAGMARLAPGFLVKQRDSVQTICLKPALLGLLKLVQYHYGEPVVITSGYRGAAHNSRVGGVRHSKHMSCEAADIQVDGISKWDLAGYLRSLPGRGGVGTYCYTDSVHLDIGEKRDWNWRCRRRK